MPIDELGLHQPDPKALVAFLKAMEFTTITKRAAETYGIDAGAIEPDPAFVGPAGWRGRNGEVQPAVIGDEVVAAARIADSSTRSLPRKNARYGEIAPKRACGDGPGELAAARAAAARATKIDRCRYETITTLEELDAEIAAAFEAGAARRRHGDDVARSDAGRTRRHLACRRAGPRLLHSRWAIAMKATGDLFGAADLLPGQLPLDAVLARLKPLLEADGVLKIAHNMKYRLARLPPARHRGRVRSTTRCSSPMCSMPASPITAWMC